MLDGDTLLPGTVYCLLIERTVASQKPSREASWRVEVPRAKSTGSYSNFCRHQQNWYRSGKIFPPIDNVFLSIFPLKDIDSHRDFDIHITTNDPDFKLNMKTFITRIGGTDVKNFIKCVLQRIFSYELSSKCSWTGF
ncbi:DUF4806 domain-containing protein [Aphis craccivora]|uniref:DUF4806 domain-containing protein n=1 Tax=Aphis craccivora TaxID=307492 RepID=A0A6G0YEF8_APHCR|nr:DUF4806 domain-containing protein [Aphis craccivora]